MSAGDRVSTGVLKSIYFRRWAEPLIVVYESLHPLHIEGDTWIFFFAIEPSPL